MTTPAQTALSVRQFLTKRLSLYSPNLAPCDLDMKTFWGHERAEAKSAGRAMGHPIRRILLNNGKKRLDKCNAVSGNYFDVDENLNWRNSYYFWVPVVRALSEGYCRHWSIASNISQFRRIQRHFMKYTDELHKDFKTFVVCSLNDYR